eukprot:scaffold28434_cov67-Phaeocystis_antarctica.AAC.4
MGPCVCGLHGIKTGEGDRVDLGSGDLADVHGAMLVHGEATRQLVITLTTSLHRRLCSCRRQRLRLQRRSIETVTLV